MLFDNYYKIEAYSESSDFPPTFWESFRFQLKEFQTGNAHFSKTIVNIYFEKESMKS